MRRHQRDHSVSGKGEPGTVQPSGHPINHSTNRGFNRRGEVWPDREHGAPCSFGESPGREDGNPLACPRRSNSPPLAPARASRSTKPTVRYPGSARWSPSSSPPAPAQRARPFTTPSRPSASGRSYRPQPRTLAVLVERQFAMRLDVLLDEVQRRGKGAGAGSVPCLGAFPVPADDLIRAPPPFP